MHEGRLSALINVRYMSSPSELSLMTRSCYLATVVSRMGTDEGNK